MRTIRVFVNDVLRSGEAAFLHPQTQAHLLKVLRLSPGDPIQVFDGQGQEFSASLVMNGKLAAALVGAPLRATAESPLKLTLIQSVCRGEKMDLILQKAVELGVSRVRPVVSERTEVRLDAERAARRQAHWRGVLIAACEQSGRATVPTLDPVLPLDQALALPGAALTLVLDPEAAMTLPKAATQGMTLDIAIAVGPEGGFGARDLAQCAAAGAITVRLGPRILRTETAGFTAMAVLQNVLGDLAL